MASIEKRIDKSGNVTSYRITVYEDGKSGQAKYRHRMSWKPDPDMNQRQIEKALNAVVQKFEEEILAGYQTDTSYRFAEYAEYVIKLKEQSGLSPRTIERYRSMMPRINAAIGNIKLTQLRPQHLNELYKNLSEAGVRTGGQKAMLKFDLLKVLKRNNISIKEFAKKTGLGESTIRSVTTKQLIAATTAEAIADALDLDYCDVFKRQEDLSPLSNKTILEHHRLISTILSQADKELLVTYNAAAKATPPKVRKKEPDYYQPDELKAIIAALDKAPIKWKALTYLLIDTGCRRGEAAGLKWECIDLNERIITIERTLQYTPEKGVYEGPTKTGKSRVIRIAPQTADVLKAYKEEQARVRRTHGVYWGNSDYVFTNADGNVMSPDSITQWLAKFSKHNDLPHIHPHAFRHTAASNMIAAGLDLVTTAGELGHANATTTATIYAHQIATAKARAGDIRANVFESEEK